MNIALIVLLLIVAATSIGVLRAARRREHRIARMALQIAAAVLIWLVLFPPHVDERFATAALVVLTPGATQAEIAVAGDAVATVALPGVVAARDVERVPDLGTALRRYPDATRVHVVGHGLPPRDVDAARGLAVTFDAAPPANGIVALTMPATVRAGAAFAVRGRLEGARGGRVELVDPSGAAISRANVGDDGTFALDASAKTPGQASFTVKAFDASGASVDSIEQGVSVTAGDPLHVLVLAGAPDPDLKYLRRWAVDAGVDLASRIVLSDGIALEDGGTVLATDALARTDLVIVDERAWTTLDASAKRALAGATRDGLGILLRVTGPVSDAVGREWSALGFRVRASDVAQTVSLAADAAPAPEVVLSRRALLVDADDATPLVRANDGSALALWRGDGEGRIAIWWLADTYRMALAGDGAGFGTLWSRALSTIARARGATRPDVPDDARIDQRGVLCGLADGAYVEAGDGSRVALSIDADARHCAAYWPARVGWQTLVSGGTRSAFLVRAADAAPALTAAANANATRRLAGSRADAATTMATRAVAMPRWPFYLAWLVVAALLWWLERGKAEVVED